MTKLFLISAGFINKNIADFFVGELDKSIVENKILLIAYAQSNEEQAYIDESVRELEDIGFENGNIIIINMHEEVLSTELDDFDIIYVCGGNTFAILQKLRQRGLDKLIIEQVNNGAIYVGVSAGSIIAGNDIEIAGWGSDGDKNDVGLQNLGGFGFTNIAIFPHFEENAREEVKQFKTKVDYPIAELTDRQAIFCKDGECKKLE